MSRVFYVFSASGLGKSTFSLSGKGKKWYAELDAGSFERAESGLDIPEGSLDIEYFYPPTEWEEDNWDNAVIDTSMVGASGKGGIQVISEIKGYKELRARFRNAYGKALQRDYSDLIIDTESNYYDVIQLAMKQKFQEELGLAAGKMKRLEYDLLYQDMFQVMRGAKGVGKNLIMLAHEKEAWAGNEATGKMIPDGCKKVMDEADVTLRFVKRNRKPVAIIYKAAGADMGLVDMEIEEPTIEKVSLILDCATAMRKNKVPLPDSIDEILDTGKYLLK